MMSTADQLLKQHRARPTAPVDGPMRLVKKLRVRQCAAPTFEAWNLAAELKPRDTISERMMTLAMLKKIRAPVLDVWDISMVVQKHNKQARLSATVRSGPMDLVAQLKGRQRRSPSWDAWSISMRPRPDKSQPDVRSERMGLLANIQSVPSRGAHMDVLRQGKALKKRKAQASPRLDGEMDLIGMWQAYEMGDEEFSLGAAML